MGVVRYLCITIALLAAFACAVNAQCGAFGTANSHGDCICLSGYTGALCDTPYSGANCPTAYANAVHDHDDRFPRLDENSLSFQHNVLRLSIQGLVVPQRQYTSLTFIQPSSQVTPISDQCKLAANSTLGSYWTQSQNAACKDNFALAMPWNSWRVCGFDPREQNAAYFVFRATFVLSYSDTFESPFPYPDEGLVTVGPMQRRSSVSYKVWVMFLKSLEISVEQAINVNNTVDLKVAITKFEYDPQTLSLTFGISSMMLWPNKYIRDTVHLSIIGGTDITTTGAAVPSEYDATCQTGNNTQPQAATATPCMQYFEFTIVLGAAADCTFDAQYKLSGTVTTCRDDPYGCTQATQEAVVKVEHSDVCGSVTANPVITGALRAYDNLHNPTSDFTVGYRGYFEADMATVNDFNLTWVDIWVVPDSAIVANDFENTAYTQIQWLYRNGAVQTANFNKYDGTTFGDFHVSPVDLQVTDVQQDSWSAGINGARVFTPKFNFRFDSRIFNVPFEGSETRRGFTLHARGHIVYAGNEAYGRKREVKVVDYVFKTDAAEMSASLAYSLGHEQAAAEETQSNSNVRADLLKSLLPVAGIALVVVACAIVAAVVIIKRRSANKFATLAN